MSADGDTVRMPLERLRSRIEATTAGMSLELIATYLREVDDALAALARLEAAEVERDVAKEQAASNADKVRLERSRANAEAERADVMQHERDWEQEVVNADLWNRLQAAEAERDRYAATLAREAYAAFRASDFGDSLISARGEWDREELLTSEYGRWEREAAALAGTADTAAEEA